MKSITSIVCAAALAAAGLGQESPESAQKGASIPARVTANTGGVPVAYAQVWVQYPRGNRTSPRHTNAEGRAEVEVAADGPYIINVKAFGFLPEQKQIEKRSQLVEIALTDAATVVGQVVDDVTGKPIPAFDVAAARSLGELFLMPTWKRSFVAPKEGPSFEYALEPGQSYWLLVKAPGYAAGRTPEITVSKGERREGVTVRLTRGATITGRVVDAKGEPIANASVSPLTPDELRPKSVFERVLIDGIAESRQLKTGPDGRFTISNLMQGSYVLVVSHPLFPAHQSPAVSVQSAGEVPTEPLVLPAGARVHGHVRLADGKPAPKAQLQLVRSDGPSVGRLNRAATNADGAFEFTGLCAGSYRLQVVDREGKSGLDSKALVGFSNPPPSTEFTLTPGEVKEINP